MKYLLLLMLFFFFSSAEIINLGQWNKQNLSSFLQDNNNKNNNLKIKNITDKFLNTPYKANTMIGSINQKEELVIDLAHLDCFTFIDYVEAMKQSKNFYEFKTNLITLRYQGSKVEYATRNHFLSDWVLYNGFKNITPSLTDKTKQITKQLNRSKNNTLFLKGIKTKQTTIDYINSTDLTKEIINKLQTGDYIGIYTQIKGLDVTHVGIFINKDGKAYFRHASSKKKFLKVVDEPFETYIKNTPGFIVLRKGN